MRNAGAFPLYRWVKIVKKVRERSRVSTGSGFFFLTVKRKMNLDKGKKPGDGYSVICQEKRKVVRDNAGII